MTVAPDFRSWGESDIDNSFFNTGQLIDTLNLINSLASVPQVDVEQIAIWGHSMGGGVALKAVTVDPRLKAAVLYAPISANEAETLACWGPGCVSSQPYKIADNCGGAEVIDYNIDANLFLAYTNAIYNPDFMRQVSSINYIHLVAAPVQIHIGAADTVTPPEWSAEIYGAMQKAGKEVEIFTYLGEGHALKGENWALFMKLCVQDEFVGISRQKMPRNDILVANCVSPVIRCWMFEDMRHCV